MRNIVVLGSGFAGLWSAIGAARRLDEAGVGPDRVLVTVVSATPFHDIRVRNYEQDLSACRIPLDSVLGPIGVRQVTARVEAIDTAAQTVTLAGHATPLRYDRLVIALGSALARPNVAGLAEFAFAVDTYDDAVRLNQHLAALADQPQTPAASTVIVVGAGLTGIEAACELPSKLARVFAGRDVTPLVMLIDHNAKVGSDMGESARPVIEKALAQVGVRAVTGVRVSGVDTGGVTLDSGDVLAVDRGVVRRHASQSAHRADPGRARPTGPIAGRRLPTGNRRAQGVSRRAMWRSRGWMTSTFR